MGFLSSLLNHSQAAACALPETHPVIRQIVSILGFDVTKTPDFASRLVPAINSAAAYFDKQIAAIPGPFELSAGHYIPGSLLHALFPARQDIAHGLGRSIDVQPLPFLAATDHKHAYGLLGLRRRPGDNTAGALPVFCDHTLRSLTESEDATRTALRNAAIMRLVTSCGEQIAEGGKDNLASSAEAAPPEVLLRTLIDWLLRPSIHLQVHSAEHDGNPPADPARQAELLPRMSSSDRRKWTVCIVRFSPDEGIAAIQNETRQHRYIQI